MTSYEEMYADADEFDISLVKLLKQFIFKGGIYEQSMRAVVAQGILSKESYNTIRTMEKRMGEKA